MNMRNDDYLLTIAVPTYNGAKTIEDMLCRLLPQIDERVEVLVSDNCSTDETPTILWRFKDLYPEIRIVRNKMNIGPDANFLSSLKLARGKFVLLLSDDDILIEGSLLNILFFLHNHPRLAVVYLHTIGFHNKYIDVKHCITPGKNVKENISTTDKKLFMEYAGFYWGFMSSFICAKDKFDKIVEPEQFYGTYWLQSYIHILCSSDVNAELGVIKGPCIGAGSYINLANFDTSLVDGVYYRKMIDFAIEKAGYDKSQLNLLYIRRLSILGKRAIIKERAAGVRKTSIKRLFYCTYRYPKAWIMLYPFLIIPASICGFIVKRYRKLKRVDGAIGVNRPE